MVPVYYTENHLLKILFNTKERKNMDIKTIIAKKREKKELTQEEIRLFVSKYNKEEITEAQARCTTCLHL